MEGKTFEIEDVYIFSKYAKRNGDYIIKQNYKGEDYKVLSHQLYVKVNGVMYSTRCQDCARMMRTILSKGGNDIIKDTKWRVDVEVIHGESKDYKCPRLVFVQ